jgi:hypothetical protein
VCGRAGLGRAKRGVGDVEVQLDALLARRRVATVVGRRRLVDRRALFEPERFDGLAELAHVGPALAAGGPAGSGHIKQKDEKQNKYHKYEIERLARYYRVCL